MLQLKYIESHTDLILKSLATRNWPDEKREVVYQVIQANKERKMAQSHLDEALSIHKKKANRIQQLYKSGETEKANALRAEVQLAKESIKELENQFKHRTQEIDDLLLRIPNVAHPSVPPGLTDADNQLVKSGQSVLPTAGPNALPHWTLAEKYDLFDLKTAAKITGSGFVLFKGKGAKLQRALIAFFLDEAINAGFLECMPPFLVNENSALATGQLPDKEGQMYHITEDNLFLIPTSEVPLTNIYRDMILKAEDLPIKLTAHSPCFRREAGSYGADVKGLNRVHQFDKVEIVQIAHPDQSYQLLDEMVTHVESLIIKLGLPYRIVRLCGGDLGFTSALTYDFEVYSIAQKKWLEVSSVSNFETFQANRLKLRFKDDTGKNRLCHTLNGSALALARIYAALLEHYQAQDHIVIPDVLVPYCGFDKIQ